MARIEEKIAEIPDAQLRQAIAEEVATLKKRTRFGLVFEEHQPEVVPVHGARIKRGERVAKKTGSLTEVWRVLKIADGQALCEKEKVKAGKADEVENARASRSNNWSSCDAWVRRSIRR